MNSPELSDPLVHFDIRGEGRIELTEYVQDSREIAILTNALSGIRNRLDEQFLTALAESKRSTPQQFATTPGGMTYRLPPGWPNPTRRDHA